MNWLKYRFLYFLISLAILLPGLYSLWNFGLNPSVEFTGGSLLEISLESSSPDQITDLLSPAYSIHSLDHDSSTITLKLDPLTQSQADQIVSDLKTLDSQAKLISFTSVGPSVGGQLLATDAAGERVGGDGVQVQDQRVLDQGVEEDLDAGTPGRVADLRLGGGEACCIAVGVTGQRLGHV